MQEISKLSGILVNLLASYQLPSADVMPFVRDTDKVVHLNFFYLLSRGGELVLYKMSAIGGLDSTIPLVKVFLCST